MAPIKFEEHIREQLDKREIQPSEGSWEKLNTRLNNEDSKKSPKWWIGVAAAVVVCLIVSLFFIDQHKQTVTPIVNNPAEEKVDQNSNEFEQPSLIASEETEAENNEGEIQEKSTGKNIANPVTKKAKTKLSVAVASADIVKTEPAEDDTPAIAENENITKVSPVLHSKNGTEIESNLLNNKIEELVAKLSNQEKSRENLTDAEVDALLVEAAAELSNERKFYAHGMVDANELLADVEADIDQSFRKEIFELLKDGFIKATTAVASRNY